MVVTLDRLGILTRASVMIVQLASSRDIVVTVVIECHVGPRWRKIQTGHQEIPAAFARRVRTVQRALLHASHALSEELPVLVPVCVMHVLLVNTWLQALLIAWLALLVNLVLLMVHRARIAR